MSCDFIALANKGVQELHPYQPGKPISELERELGITNIVKLASNENPIGLSGKAKAAMEKEFADLARYPDANGYYLKAKLSERLGVGINQITLGNGSNDVLELIARVFVAPEHEVIYSQHAFVVYPIVTQAIGAKKVIIPAKDWGHDLEATAAAITPNTRMIFIANPNNPTGTWVNKTDLKAFMDKVPQDVIVVVDEAYYEYVEDADYPQTVPWIKEYPNLIVTRTFSKAYGLAGARAGYAVANEEITGLINRPRQPFNMNSLALAAAVAVLDDHEYLQKALDVNKSGMQQLISAFDELGYDYIPSVTNFITVDMKQAAGPLYQQMLEQGVIVRPVGNYEMPNHLRISIGLEEENAKFIRVLREMTK
ncbi:histidinol-phosphate transaminase [Kangiella koreensis]|uniref:Histidinol-phosphate aminotransferase n=1 Tax=Kangiella koreensis (strain DSM 16069 / JCM 12317 / KCTC 12182 / SW-125) TaxID=523791 RepID=C7RAM4_KANKD|nr:histidinol-phosphate transaminase [Kangiella koreensis]ACV26316.1 histidinol-phosphate aminotransferase [Kangiella koreensis DSM 16069]